MLLLIDVLLQYVRIARRISSCFLFLLLFFRMVQILFIFIVQGLHQEGESFGSKPHPRLTTSSQTASV